MVEGTSSNNIQVLANVVGSVKVFDMVLSNVGNVFTNTKYRLTYEVVSERCIMNSFSGS